MGPQGPIGPMGLQGPAGDKGPTGDPGGCQCSYDVNVLRSPEFEFTSQPFVLDDSRIDATSIVLVQYTEAGSTGNAASVMSIENNRAVLSGSPNKHFYVVIITPN